MTAPNPKLLIALDQDLAKEGIDSMFSLLRKLSLSEAEAEQVLDTLDRNWRMLIDFVRTRKRQTHAPVLFFAKIQPSYHLKQLQQFCQDSDRVSFFNYLNALDAHRVRQAARQQNDSNEK